MRAYTGATFAGVPSVEHDGHPAGIGTIGYRLRQRRHSNPLGTAMPRAYPLTATGRPVSTSWVIYCVIPRELEGELLDRMTEHYAGNPNVQVIVDRREGGENDRRRFSGSAPDERRQTRDRRRPRALGTFPRIDAFDEE